MNLSRHTLTSHAPTPTFVNAQFYNVSERYNEQEEGQYRLDVGNLQISRGKRESSIAKASNQASSSSSQDKGKGKIVEDDHAKKCSVSMFACATTEGYFIARTHPLGIIARRGETGS